MSSDADSRNLAIQNERLKAVLSISRELGGNLDLEQLLPDIISRVTAVMDADRSSLFLHDAQTQTLYTFIAEGLDVNEIRIPVGAGICGEVARTRTRMNIPDAYACPSFDPSFDTKTGYRTKSVLCMPLDDRHGHLLGVIQVLNKNGGLPFNEDEETFLAALSSQIAMLLENASLYHKIERTFENIVAAIARAIDSRDPVTAGHSRRVSQYTLQLARGVHDCSEAPFADITFSRNQMRELRYASLLHDFGKVGVPESILQKSERLQSNLIHVVTHRLHANTLQEQLDRLGGMTVPEHDFDATAAFLAKINRSGFLSDEDAQRLKMIYEDGLITPAEYTALSIRKGTLTAEERQVMEGHVRKTYDVLSAIEWPDEMKEVPLIAASHHEAEDGTGYPQGLRGDQIPLGGKCMAVADVYDALTAQDRPYKPAIPHDKSCAILRDMAAHGKLNSDLVELFITRELFMLPAEASPSEASSSEAVPHDALSGGE